MKRPYVSAETATHSSVDAALRAAFNEVLVVGQRLTSQPPQAPHPRPLGESRRRAVTIRGVTYQSRTEAAKALGVAVSTICNALKRGTIEDVGLRTNAAR